MDSNFQVKITADISALQASMKSVESQLQKFDASTNKASGAMSQASSNANRMSLAAFALGQVIRDSGFFAQNFALGILAISNNIPILIDQLTKLLALSAGVAAAISLVASVLTAGLTIWAYSAMAAKDAGEEYEKAMEKANTSSQAQIATFNSLLAVARDTNLSNAERKQAIDKLNKSYDGLNEQLNIANINDKESIDLTNRVANALVLQAEATALATLAGEAYVANLKARNSAVQDYATTENNIFAQVLRNLGFFVQAEKLLIENGAKNRTKVIDESKKAYDDYAKKLQEINVKLAKSGMLDTDKDGGKGVADVYKELALELKKVNANVLQTFTQKSKDRANAYQKAIESLIDLGLDPASDAITKLQLLALKFDYDADGLKRFEDGLDRAAQATKNLKKEFDKAERSTELVIPDQDMPPVFDTLNADKGKITASGIRAYADSLLPSVMEVYASIAATITDGMAEVTFAIADGIGKMITGEMGVKDFGRSILASMGSFLSQLGKQMMAFGIAALLFAKINAALASGNFATVIALAPGLIAAGAALAIAGSVISSLTSGKKGNAAMAGGGGINTGGFTSNFTKPMSSSVGAAMYGQYSGTLETRVSGNDLVILMNRAGRNRRGNY